MALPEDRLQIIVFGKRGAGKTGFANACSRVDSTVEFIDTDSLADEEALASGSLPEPMIRADALAVTIDISASEREIDDAVESVQSYLTRVERERLNEREAAGWPITIVLTKCDQLLERGLTAPEWLDRIRDRVGPIRNRFEQQFAARSPHFGDINVTIWPTATRTPALAGSPTDATGGYGIVTCATHLAAMARNYRQRTIRTNRRMKQTLAAIAGILVAALAMAVISEWVSSPRRESKLVAAIHAYQANERTTAIRLSEARRPRIKSELAAMRDDADFGNLPEDLREFVNVRLEEMGRYETYAKQFRRPSPADCRSHRDVDQLVQELKSTLAPPPGDAANWSDTEAVRLREKWARDIDLLRDAEARIYNWSRDLTRTSNELYLKNPGETGWYDAVSKAINAADTPPFKVDEIVPGTTELPVAGGERLTYATAFEFDRVEASRRDWEFSRDRLSRFREFVDTLGLVRQSPSKSAGLLDWTDLPRDRTALLHFATERLARLRERFPSLVSQPAPFAASLWPDPSREDIRKRLSRSLESAAVLLREQIRQSVREAGGGKESAAAWKMVSTSLLEEPGFRDWGKLLSLVQQLNDEPAEDPVSELIALLEMKAVQIPACVMEITMPFSNPERRFRADSELAIKMGDQAVAARRIGDARVEPTVQTYRYAVEPFTIPQGKGMTFVLKGTVAGVAHEMIWDRPRSTVCPEDAIRLEPKLTAVNGRVEPAVGIVVRVVPESAWPRTPLLLPDLRTNDQSKP